MGKFGRFLTELSAGHMSEFWFSNNSLNKYQWIFTNLVCALIFWRSGSGLLMGKLRQFLTELSASHTRMAGYYRSMLFFLNIFSPNLRGGGHIDFGVDPIGVGVGVGISVTLSCPHNIL